MIIEYCRSKTYNFGDDLNPWLWPQLLGDELFVKQDGIYLVGIGTVLTSKRLNIQLADAKEIVIFSSGTWDDFAPALSDKCKVYGVRGPRTAKRLGLSADKIIGDGAYLLRKLELPAIIKNNDIGFIPHHGSEQYINWEEVCKIAGIKFISAKQPVESFLDELRSCKRIITEAMHGAIVADAMRIPWTPVKFSPLFCEEKWFDFSETMKLDICFHKLPFLSQNAMPFFKMLEVGGKKIISKLLGIKPKWSDLIFTGFGTGQEATNLLINTMEEVITLNKTYLSSDEVVDQVTENQYKRLMQLKADYS